MTYILDTYPQFRGVDEIFLLPWERVCIQPTLKVGGVYILFNRLSIYPYDYVGQAVSFQRRLFFTEHKVYDRDIHDIYILRIEDHDIMNYVEAKLIHLLKPRFNKNRGVTNTTPKEIFDRDCKELFFPREER